MARGPASPSVHAVPALRAAVLALRLAPREVRNRINRDTRSEFKDWWGEELRFNIDTPLERAMFSKGYRIAAGVPAAVVAGTSRRPLSGGLVPNVNAAAIEFGTWAPNEFVTYTRRNRTGGTHTVRRRTKAGLPKARSTGHVVYPAWARMAPRIISRWAQTIVKNIMDAVEEGQI